MIEPITLPDQMRPVSHYCHVTRAGNLVWVAHSDGSDHWFRSHPTTLPDGMRPLCGRAASRWPDRHRWAFV